MRQRVRLYLAALPPRGRVRRWLLLAVVLGVPSIALAVWYFRPDPQRVAAEQALQRHDYHGAYRLLQGCLQRRPDDAPLLLLAGRTARRAGLYEQAAKHFNAYRRLQGETSSLTLEWSLMRAQRGDWQAEPYLKARADAGDPDAPLIWEVLTQLYLDAYRLFEARACLDHYLECYPDDVLALLGRAYIWERLLHYPEAVRDYRRAVGIEPDNDRARLGLAENLLIVGPPEDAAEQFEWLRRRHADDAAASLGLARAWRQQGHIEAARQLLDALLREHPRHVGALTERGRLALEEGQPRQGADWLRRAVERAPHDREALYNLSRCLQECGSPDEARQCQSRFERADADLKRLGQLTKDVLREPDNAALRCEGGILFLNNGEEQEGVRWLRQALRLDPGYRPAHKALADYYQRTGQSELAARQSSVLLPPHK
jgi:Tfp pilus assembly protein PilF